MTARTSGHPQVTHSTVSPGEPVEWRQSYSNVPGQTEVDPGTQNERTHYKLGYALETSHTRMGLESSLHITKNCSESQTT